MVRISDKKLIDLLEENSRRSFVSIANIFGVSETAIRKRVKNLERKGVIKRYTVDIDYKKIGLNVHALIGIDTTPESYIYVIESLKSMNEVKNLYSSTGDHMLMVETILKNSEELSNFVKKLEKIRGVTRVCPAILLEKLK